MPSQGEAEGSREGGGVLIANSEPWREIFFFSLGALAHIFSLAAAAEGLAVF